MREWIANFALNALWQCALISACALLASRGIRRTSGRTRHALLVAALLACAAVPLLGVALTPRWAPFFARQSFAGADLVRDAAPVAIVPIAFPTKSPERTADAIALAYALLLLHALLTLIRASLHARRIRRSATGEVPQVSEMLASLGGRDVVVRSSNAITSAATIGAWRPMIVVPPALAADSLVPVLAHELAHVRRRDGLVQWIIELATLPVAFHPLVRMLKREAATAREIACDQHVAPALVEPRRYAETLLALATSQPQPIAFGDAAALEMRLLSLRDTPGDRKPRRMLALAAVTVLGTVAVGASLFRFDLFGTRRHDALSGHWLLDPKATNFGPVTPYQTFSQTLQQKHRVFRSWQTRVRNGRSSSHEWRVKADGVRRRVRVGKVNGTARARWDGDALVLELSTANGHWERTRASVGPDRNTLICEGEVRERGGGGPFRFVFRRVKREDVPRSRWRDLTEMRTEGD